LFHWADPINDNSWLQGKLPPMMILGWVAEDQLLGKVGTGLHYHTAAPDMATLTSESNNHFRKRFLKANHSSTISEGMVIRKHVIKVGG
jgi:hypothetical protein